MPESDPHVHVDAKLHADVAVRNRMAATFGLAADLPSRATTGCGRDVPYATTSTSPDGVTCPDCRGYAHRRYLELADDVQRMGRMPGAPADVTRRAAHAGDQYRDLARRFADPR